MADISEPVTLTVLANGPILVAGDVLLKAPDGTPITSEKPRIALCRCGASANKPFCDGAHGRTGFQG